MIRTLPICLVLAVCMQPTVAQDNPKKDPVPDQAAQDKALVLIKRLFEADFAKRKPADVLELAGKLHQQALETNDDVTARYVLLRASQNLAASVGDFAAAFKAIDEMDRRFTVNAPQLKATALATIVNSGTSQNLEGLARSALGVIDQALTLDDFETAQRLAKIAEAAAQKSKSVPLVTSARSRGKLIEAQKKELDRVKADFELLRKTPDDSAACARVGKFLCFYKGDWEKGLALLTKGNDAKLQELAKRDLEAPMDTSAQVTVGDGWYDLAQAQEEGVKGNLLVRARHWYKKAAEGNLTGLAKTKVEKRLMELDNVAADASTDKDWLVLFRSADPKIWNKNQRDNNNFAIALDKLPDDLKFVRLTNAKTGDYRIVPVTRDKLMTTSDDGRYGWNGTNKNEYGGYHLGIYDRENNANARDTVCVWVPGAFQGYKGWGFGHKCDNSGTGFIWDNQVLPATVFEIAVKTTPLTATESKKLLKK